MLCKGCGEYHAGGNLRIRYLPFLLRFGVLIEMRLNRNHSVFIVNIESTAPAVVGAAEPYLLNPSLMAIIIEGISTFLGRGMAAPELYSRWLMLLSPSAGVRLNVFTESRALPASRFSTFFRHFAGTNRVMSQPVWSRFCHRRLTLGSLASPVKNARRPRHNTAGPGFDTQERWLRNSPLSASGT